jgi:DNA-damage-inducible protein J
LCYNVAQNLKKETIMAANAVVRARVNEQIKDEASVVLEAMGLTLSDAFRIMITRIAKEKALPFEPLVPNAQTIEAMKEARAGKLQSFNAIDDLMANLNADD